MSTLAGDETSAHPASSAAIETRPIFLENVDGETLAADHAGRNDAYRKLVANVDLTTGLVISSG